MVLKAGLVDPVSSQELSAAAEADRKLRGLTRKGGHTTPLSTSLAKRPRTGSSILEQQRLFLVQPHALEHLHQLPSNAVDLLVLPPRKRIRVKSSAEVCLQQCVQ
jgi:hypothetical protein